MFGSMPLGRELRDLSREQRRQLLLIFAAAAALYLFYAWDRPLKGDEAGTYLYIGRDIRFLLTHFEPWLTQNYFIIAEKILYEGFGEHLFLLKAIPLACALGAIPLCAAVFVRIAPQRTAILATALTSFNPAVFQLSSVARAYSAMLFFSLLQLLSFLRWRERPSPARAAAAAVAACLLVLVNPIGVYFAAALWALATVDVILDLRRRADREKLLRAILLAGLLAAAGAVTALAYRNILPETGRLFGEGGRFFAPPPASISYIPRVFQDYFGRELRWLLSLALLLMGVVAALRRQPALLSLLLFPVAPVALMSLAGLQHHEWAYSRFLVFTLPVWALFLALGIEAVACIPPLGRWRLSVAVLAAIQLACWAPKIHQVFRAKTDTHRSIPAYIAATYPEGRIVSALDHVAALELAPYLDRLEPFRGRTWPFSKLLSQGPETLEMVLVVPAEPQDALPERYHREGPYGIAGYRARSQRMLFRKILADLVAITGGRADPALAHHYQAIAALREALGPKGGAQRSR